MLVMDKTKANSFANNYTLKCGGLRKRNDEALKLMLIE